MATCCMGATLLTSAFAVALIVALGLLFVLSWMLHAVAPARNRMVALRLVTRVRVFMLVNPCLGKAAGRGRESSSAPRPAQRASNRRARNLIRVDGSPVLQGMCHLAFAHAGSPGAGGGRRGGAARGRRGAAGGERAERGRYH